MQGQVFGGCEDGLITDSALLRGHTPAPQLLPAVPATEAVLSVQARPCRCPPLLPKWDCKYFGC